MVSSISLASLTPGYLGASPSQQAPPQAQQAMMILRNIQAFSGGVHFAENIQITGQVSASDPQNAAALAAVFKLGVTFASTMGGNNTQAKELSQWAQALQVTTSGSTVNLSLAIPETQVEALLDQVLKPPPAGARARLH